MNIQTRERADLRSHDERLDLLAEVAVRVGLGLEKGQEVVMTAPLGALPLARRITEHAYKAGAALVTTLFSDDEATLMRFRHAPEDSFDRATGWLFDGMAAAFRGGAARLAIVGDDPALLSGQDPDKVARANRARSKAYLPALELIAGFDINWTIVSYATPAWAKAVFPADSEEVALAKLWHGIFAASRIDTPDPVVELAGATTATSRSGAPISTRSNTPHSISAGPAPTSASALPTIMSGRAVRRAPRTASCATPTSRRKRCSRRRTRTGSTARSGAPSRSPTRAR